MSNSKSVYKILIIVLLVFVVTVIYICVKEVKKLELFTIKSVEIKGVINSNRDKLSKLGQEFIGMNIFDEDVESLIYIDDQWIQKLQSKRVLPNKILLIVYEEKELFRYKRDDKCYVYTATEKDLPIICENINIIAESILDSVKLNNLAEILSEYPELKSNDMRLRALSFDVIKGNEIVVAPYSYNIFKKNYDKYLTKVRLIYKVVDYVDLTVDGRIYVKGERNASNKR